TPTASASRRRARSSEGTAVSDAVSSEVQRLTFFEDRAEVVRRGAPPPPPPPRRGGGRGAGGPRPAPPPGGGGRGAGARGRGGVRAASAAEIEAIEAELRAARVRRVAAERAAERAQSQERRAVVLLEDWRGGVDRVPRGGAAGWREGHEALASELARALDEIA